MAIKVSRILELMNEYGARDDYYIYSINSASLEGSREENRCACFALKELELIQELEISSLSSKSKNFKHKKIIVIIEVLRDLDYYNPLTVRNLKDFLENINDKDEKIYIATPLGLNIANYIDVINISIGEIDGKNIFYLWI